LINLFLRFLEQEASAFHTRHDGSIDFCRRNVHVGTFFVMILVEFNFGCGHGTSDVGLAFASLVARGCQGCHHQASSAYAKKFLHFPVVLNDE
jgi:hypothetical protein